jgi:hypothetical protein
MTDIKNTFVGITEPNGTTNGGGWYEYPLNEKLSIMCINSIYWSDSGINNFIKVG